MAARSLVAGLWPVLALVACLGAMLLGSQWVMLDEDEKIEAALANCYKLHRGYRAVVADDQRALDEHRKCLADAQAWQPSPGESWQLPVNAVAGGYPDYTTVTDHAALVRAKRAQAQLYCPRLSAYVNSSHHRDYVDALRRRRNEACVHMMPPVS